MNTRTTHCTTTARSENGQFTKASPPKPILTTTITNINFTFYIYLFILVIILFPLVYHIFIRKNFMTWIIDVLDKEFGFNCTLCDIALKQSFENEKSKMVYKLLLKLKIKILLSYFIYLFILWVHRDSHYHCYQTVLLCLAWMVSMLVGDWRVEVLDACNNCETHF